MSASVQQVMAQPVQGVAAQSYVMPDMFASPGLTMVPGQLQAAPAVTYAAAPAVTYAAAPSVTYAPVAASVVYTAPQAGSATYAAAAPTSRGYGIEDSLMHLHDELHEVVVGVANATVLHPSISASRCWRGQCYAAPATYSAPVGGQPVYTISPERFQRIMAGEPLTNEEIAMTGHASAPIAKQAGGQSFAMPDMFASPGLTMVGGQQGEFSQPAASASTVAAATTFEPAAATPVEPLSAESPASAKVSDKKKRSDKKSSKKKLSSKKKSKGCC